MVNTKLPKKKFIIRKSVHERANTKMSEKLRIYNL